MYWAANATYMYRCPEWAHYESIDRYSVTMAAQPSDKNLLQ